MTRRINARIDEEMAAEIRRITGQSTTAIIKSALSAYIERLQATQVSPAIALEGFIGCAEGDPDQSTRYKATLGESWSNKV